MHDLTNLVSGMIDQVGASAHAVNDFAKEWWGLFLVTYIIYRVLVVTTAKADQHVQRLYWDRQEEEMLARLRSSSQSKARKVESTQTNPHVISRPLGRDDIIG